jgi:hypothetical protein
VQISFTNSVSPSAELLGANRIGLVGLGRCLQINKSSGLPRRPGNPNFAE